MNRIVVITGGTSGIGKYLANKFGKKDKVYVLSRNVKKIAAIKEEFWNLNVEFIPCNLLNKCDIENAFTTISKKEKKVDVLINNAAYDKMSNIEDYDYDEFSKIINTNLVGKMYCIQCCVKLLTSSEYPSIVNIASRLAMKPMLSSSAYCCAASGIVMLTKCAALELEKYKIRVNCISPSMTNTPLAKQSYSMKEMEETASKSTRKRLCKMNDIYHCINFLISPKADYINGENINISGGLLLK